MKSSPTYMTRAKYDAFQKELHYMEKEGDVKLSKLLAAAPGSGMGRPLDLPIHQTAGMFYADRDAIKAKLKSVIIIDDYVKNIEDLSKIDIGAKVKLVDVDTNEIDEYYLLGSDEADPRSGRISFSSDLGQSLLGKKKGDVVILKSGYKAKIDVVEYGNYDFEYPTDKWENKLNNIEL